MMLALIVVLAFGVTFLGGAAPSFHGAMTRIGVRRLVAMRAGILLALALTDLLPEGMELSRAVAGWTALGAFGFLFIVGSVAMLDTCPEYLQDCHVHYLGASALMALSLHSFLDGFNLAVSFGVGAAAGMAAGAAMLLHKLADGFTLSTLLGQAGLAPGRMWATLAFVAAATPLGAALSALGLVGLPPVASAALLGFAAGCFIHIAASDVLPLIHKRPDRGSIIAFAAAVAATCLLERLAHG